MDHFGKRLRRLRGNRSQKDIADALGMPQTTYSSLENQQAVPRGTVLEKLTRFFRVDVSYFYGTEPTATEAAKSWLEYLRTSNYGANSVATHSDEVISEEVKEKLEESIRKKKHAKTQNK